MKAFKLMILTAFLVLQGILSGCSPDEKRPVVFADPGWDSVRFHNAVAQLVAEKVYGLKTEILYGSTPITQAALVRGDADVNMELWTDNVPTYEADKAAGGSWIWASTMMITAKGFMSRATSLKVMPNAVLPLWRRT